MNCLGAWHRGKKEGGGRKGTGPASYSFGFCYKLDVIINIKW